MIVRVGTTANALGYLKPSIRPTIRSAHSEFLYAFGTDPTTWKEADDRTRLWGHLWRSSRGGGHSGRMAGLEDEA